MDKVSTIFRRTFILTLFLFCGIELGECNVINKEIGDNLCVIPLDYETEMSMYNLTSKTSVHLSAIHAIQHGELVLFVCSKVDDHLYEPSRRRFQCVHGNWMEADRPSYIHGNNGTFPKCRKAICDPPCENGGTCIRDNECRCNSDLITGEQCQTILCHENCTSNGGECVRPGICGNCPLSRSGRNCEIQGCFIPDNKDFTYMKENGVIVSTHDQIENGETLYVKCSSDERATYGSNGEYDQYDCYTPMSEKPQALPEQHVTCKNGILSEPNIHCSPGCFIPDNRDFTYMKENGVIVSTHDQIENGETLYVKCSSDESATYESYGEYDQYDYYAPMSEKPQALPEQRVTCKNGILSKPNIHCSPGCFIPDNRDFTYMKENGVIVSTHDQIENEETLYVRCSSDESATYGSYDEYDLYDYHTPMSEKPQALPEQHVTCKNGILSEPNIHCSPDGANVPDCDIVIEKDGIPVKDGGVAIAFRGKRNQIYCKTLCRRWKGATPVLTWLDAGKRIRWTRGRKYQERVEFERTNILNIRHMLHRDAGEYTCTGRVSGFEKVERTVNLLLDCPHEGYLCDTSKCVDKTRVCDGNFDCQDETDEMLCDDCMIPEDHDSSKITVSMDKVQMSGGTRVNHGNNVTVDCTERFGNIMEPDNRLYWCRAGKWILDDVGEHKWLDENDGAFPQCKIIKKGCQVPQKFSDDMQVNMKDGTEVSERMYIRHEETITLDCGKTFVKSLYTCNDGEWNADEHINPGVVKEGDTVRCKVTSSQQPQRPTIYNYIFHGMENVGSYFKSIFKKVVAMADKVTGQGKNHV